MKIWLGLWIGLLSFSIQSWGMDTDDAAEATSKSIGQGLGGTARDIQEINRLKRERKRNIARLREALSRCGSCAEKKRLQSELDYWLQTDKAVNDALKAATNAVGLPYFAVSPQKAHSKCEYLLKLHDVCIVNGNDVGCRDMEQPFLDCRQNALNGEEWIPDEKTKRMLKRVNSVQLKDCYRFERQHISCLNQGRRARTHDLRAKCDHFSVKADQCKNENKVLLANQLPEYKIQEAPEPDWSAYVETGTLPSGNKTHSHRKCYELYKAMVGEGPIPDSLKAWQVQGEWIKCEDANAEGAGLEMAERRRKRNNNR